MHPLTIVSISVWAFDRPVAATNRSPSLISIFPQESPSRDPTGEKETTLVEKYESMQRKDLRRLRQSSRGRWRGQRQDGTPL